MNPGASQAGAPRVRFGPFELDLAHREVFRNGIRLKLQQQPCCVLELLIERAPQIVPREDIRHRIWGDSVHVDADQGIAFCIRQVRSALDDDATSPRYIETIPRQGFRFIGNVETAPDKQVSGEAARVAEPVSQNGVQPSVPARRNPRQAKLSLWVALGVFAIALLVGTGAIALRLVRLNHLYTVSRMNSISAFPGTALHPCYSPDGRQVTFSWNAAGARSIYVVVPRSDSPLRLTHNTASDDFPMWSPDGKYIAFLRFRNPRESELMLVPALGGEERPLHSVHLSLETISSSSYLGWTPDSKQICFTTRPEKSESRVGLVLISLETGESRPVFFSNGGNTSDSSPAFSADGRWLAFTRFSSFYNSTIILQRLSPKLQPDGNPIAVLGAGQNPLSPVWTQDSRSLLFLDRLPSRLLQAEISDVESLRPAHQLYVSTTRLEGLSFAGPEPRLATSTFSDGTDLWSMSLTGNSPGARVPRKILASKASQFHPEYSPDGRWLAFVSDRDGSSQVWIASANGEYLRQVTHLANYILGFPCWSPDGQFIGFHARVPDDAELYVARVRDGVLRQVTHGMPGVSAPSWSTDGKFLYGFGPHDRSEYLFRVSLTSGKRELLWEGTQPQEVPDRHLLLYEKINGRGMFVRRLTEHAPAEPEQKLVDDLVFLGGRGFVPVRDGFYYSASDAAGTPRAFCFYSFDNKQTVDVAPAPQNLANGLAISPDRSTLIYATTRSDEADLISLELRPERR